MIPACILLAGLAVTACGEPSDTSIAGEQPVVPSPGVEQVDIRVQDMQPDTQERVQPAPVIETVEKRKPLNLSMPPQPVIDAQPGDSIDPSDNNLLPDLFQKEQKPGDGHATQLKGRVLMREEEQSLESFEGGQLIIEKKTR
jgi:hypothetical protein